MDKFNDFLGFAFVGFLIVLAICLVVLIISLPFAFVGWILLLAVSIFTDITITYMSCLILGIAAAIVGSILKR